MGAGSGGAQLTAYNVLRLVRERLLPLSREVERYSEELALTPHCVVLTKVDLLGPEGSHPKVDAPGAWGIYPISAVTREGLPSLLESLFGRTRVEEMKAESAEEEEEWWVPE